MINITSKPGHFDRDSKRQRSYKTKNDDLLLKRPTILSKTRANDIDKSTVVVKKKDENSKPITKSDSYDTIKSVIKLESDLSKLVLKPANQQSAPKPVIIQQPVLKDPIAVFNNSVIARLATQSMKGSCKLLDDNLQFIDTLDQFMSDSNESFTVIGVLGKKGVGKSTLMSMLAGCDDFEKFVFKPAGQETEQSQHKTNGIDAFVTKERSILLDIQPLLSGSVLDKNVQVTDKKSFEFKYQENYVQIQSIELACFCLSVCNVVVLMEDWFLDPNLITLIHTAEMLMPSMSEMDQSYEHRTHLVYCLNKCDYLSRVDLVRMKAIFENLMKDSKLNFKGSLNGECNSNLNPSFMSSFKAKRAQKNDDVNFLVMPSLKADETKEFNGMVNMERSIKNLVKELLSVKRQTGQLFTEKKWFSYACKMWETIKKSSFITEYSRLMT